MKQKFFVCTNTYKIGRILCKRCIPEDWLQGHEGTDYSARM